MGWLLQIANCEGRRRHFTDQVDVLPESGATIR